MSRKARPLFPTRVGVFPNISLWSLSIGAFPHTRGGVSAGTQHRRTASCLFPTRVGVFLLERASKAAASFAFPHTRGGVSTGRPQRGQLRGFSPHAWGCFYLKLELVILDQLFPTRVGVFLPLRDAGDRLAAFPHTRGGVSFGVGWERVRRNFSPHAWGCFFNFSARMLVRKTFPHTRGGVSTNGRKAGQLEPFSPHAWGCFCV